MAEPDPDAAFHAAEIRRPDDVPVGTPLTWLAERRTEASLRLMNTSLPNDCPDQVERGAVADALTELALGEALSRRVSNERGSTIRQALLLGATWDAVAAALDTTVAAAAHELKVWADDQYCLHRHQVAENPDTRVGLDGVEHAAMMGAYARGKELAAADARDGHRHREAVAAVPMLDTVGELRALLERLPDQMPLTLDDHPRALPGAGNRVHTVHPRRVVTVSEPGTNPQWHEPHLMLTQVYIPEGASDEEQAAIATRHDLPPAHAELARASYHLQRGDLEHGLGDLAAILSEAAHLMSNVAPCHVKTRSEQVNALRTEAERLTQAALQVRKLADELGPAKGNRH
ncbi:hypothetical protein ABK046_33670 [Streptomyces caeruleatus]